MTSGSLPVIQSSSSSLSLEDSTKVSGAFFQKVVMLYLRDSDYNCINKVIYKDELKYTNFFSRLAITNKDKTNDFVYLSDFSVSEAALLVWEKETANGVVGLVTRILELNDFNKWMINLLLSSSRISFPNSKLEDYKTYTKLIMKEFVEKLKFTTANDKWDEGGEIHFEKKLDFFTSRGIQIEAVLPAFPCKSSNTNKVSGWKPDRGEELALKKLCAFARLINSIYPPGMVIWIVSDGHVFSDCIGVDDEVVNNYGQELKAIYNSFGKADEGLIKFCSLLDIFNLEKFPLDVSMLKSVVLDHHVPTKLDETSELCRKLMMQSCDTDCGQLRKDIDTPNHPRLALYQGFNKFMIEDLASHDAIVKLSKKQHKKIAKNTAFEMIKRNDAYSNLVELMFPVSLRFSIHAHINSGPKYGIKLLDPSTCKPIKSLEECTAPKYDDLLHIPTPWHNTVFKYEGEDYFFLTRSGVIKKAIAEGTHKGGWDEEDKCFHLSSK